MHDIEDSARFVSARCATSAARSRWTTSAPATPPSSHLKSLTVDVVKIDGSFVQATFSASRPSNQLFLRNLLSLAQTYRPG